MLEYTQKTPRQKFGWKMMMAGFLLVVTAGIVLYVAPRGDNPVLYSKLGYYLMVGGLVVYVVGRILRWRGRPNKT
jgi:hypothetical protein